MSINIYVSISSTYWSSQAVALFSFSVIRKDKPKQSWKARYHRWEASQHRDSVNEIRISEPSISVLSFQVYLISSKELLTEYVLIHSTRAYRRTVILDYVSIRSKNNPVHHIIQNSKAHKVDKTVVAFEARVTNSLEKQNDTSTSNSNPNQRREKELLTCRCRMPVGAKAHTNGGSDKRAELNSFIIEFLNLVERSSY